MSVATPLPTQAIRILAMLAAAALFAGCSAVSGGLRSPTMPPSGPSALAGGSSIGGVTIALDEEQLPPAVADVARLYEIERILGNRVREQFRTRGVSGSSGLKVEVDVVGMRLRSNGTAIWWGFMAGGDWITVEVEVKENGKSIKKFQTGTGTALGGMIFGGRSTRVGRMMKTLAIRIADGV